MTVAVLDASALLALLLDEPGAKAVQAVLADSVISAVNLGEVVGHFARNGVALADIRSVLDPLPVVVHSFDAEQGYTAGILLPCTRTAGLSLGDRACLALARHLAVPVLTADRVWGDVAEAVGIEITVIR